MSSSVSGAFSVGFVHVHIVTVTHGRGRREPQVPTRQVRDGALPVRAQLQRPSSFTPALFADGWLLQTASRR